MEEISDLGYPPLPHILPKLASFSYEKEVSTKKFLYMSGKLPSSLRTPPFWNFAAHCSILLILILPDGTSTNAGSREGESKHCWADKCAPTRRSMFNCIFKL